MILGGTIYLDGNPKRGFINTLTGEFKEQEPDRKEHKGTIMLAPINSHTHLGDSFIKEEPMGTLPEIVGPGGFKLTHLKNAKEIDIIRGVKAAKRMMRENGTGAFIEFRETGFSGLNTILEEKRNKPFGVILSRPQSVEDYYKIKEKVDGVGLSAVSDDDIGAAKELVKAVKDNNGITAIHFSEDRRENISDLREIEPDLLIHCLSCTKDDLREIADMGAPIVITPRSNVFYGKRPDYQHLIGESDKILLGTDNGMNSDPNIFREMEFLFRYQRGIMRTNPTEILEMVINRPRKFLTEKGINVPPSFVLFPNVDLDPYEIVMRSFNYKSRKISHNR
ncbi:MAG: amidohydrolase family protein [Thermoplasmataceae archaeon]